MAKYNIKAEEPYQVEHLSNLADCALVSSTNKNEKNRHKIIY